MRIFYLLFILFFIQCGLLFSEDKDSHKEDWLYSVDSSVVLKGHVPKLFIKPSKPFDEKTDSGQKEYDEQHYYDDVYNSVDKKDKKQGQYFKETQKGLEYDKFNDYMKADVFENGGKIKKVKYDYSSIEEKNQ